METPAVGLPKKLLPSCCISTARERSVGKILYEGYSWIVKEVFQEGSSVQRGSYILAVLGQVIFRRSLKVFQMHRRCMQINLLGLRVVKVYKSTAVLIIFAVLN